MRRVQAILVVTLSFIAIHGPFTLYAQTANPDKPAISSERISAGHGTRFINVDKDGICDRHSVKFDRHTCRHSEGSMRCVRAGSDRECPEKRNPGWNSCRGKCTPKRNPSEK